MSKRYVVTVDLYIYANSDEEAKKEAGFHKDCIRLIGDNKAEVLSIHEVPYGQIGKAREVK